MYLSNRSQRTACVGWCLLHLVRSSVCVVSHRAPFWGRYFFVVFISDLPDVVLPGNTIALFADDCKISRVIDDASDQFCFQRNLDNLHHCNIRNAMVFNVKKCKVMRLTKKRQPSVSNYSLPILFWKKLKNSKTWELQLLIILTGTRTLILLCRKCYVLG